MQNQNNFVGVKYIGNKPSKSDNVTNSGAIWLPGQVHNFTTDLANQLLAHKGVFELADVVADGGTFVGNGKAKKITQEPMAFVNLNNMGAKELAAYARLNFNSTLDSTQTVEELRTQVQRLMTNSTLDEEELRQKASKPSDGSTISLVVTEPEYQAYLHGIVELRLVPVEAKAVVPVEPVKPVTPPVEWTATTEVTPIVISEPVEAKQADEKPAEPANEALPTLPALLAKLDKKGLITLAKENGVKTSNTMTEEMLRTKLLKELAAGEG